MKKVICCIVFLFVLTGICFAEGKLSITELTKIKEVKPGDKYEGKVDIENVGDEPLQVDVTLSDYIFNAKGINDYPPAGTVARSSGKWTTIDRRKLIIQPKSGDSVKYTTVVPNGPDIKGTYWCALQIAPIAAAKPVKQEKKDDKTLLRMGLQTRVAFSVQLVTNIGNTGNFDVKFLEKEISTTPEGRRVFQIGVENTGERWLRASISTELYKEDGTYVGKFDGEKWRIYPTCSVRYNIDLTKLEKGKYKSLVVLDNGDDNVFGAQYDIEL